MQEKIEKEEARKSSWILNGFPRTRVQAMALQKWGIVPDKIMSLEHSKSKSISRFHDVITSTNSGLEESERQAVAQRMWTSFETHYREVTETFKDFIWHCKVDDRSQKEVVNDIITMLNLRYDPRKKFQRRSPKIYLVGCPGSGRST